MPGTLFACAAPDRDEHLMLHAARRVVRDVDPFNVKLQRFALRSEQEGKDENDEVPHEI